MDATPDYSKCSLRELRDVAARVDKQKYPDRYALVSEEIARREKSGDNAATARAKKPITVWDFVSVLLAMAGGALSGFIVGALIFVIFNRPYGPNYGEGIGWGFAMIGNGMFGALVGVAIGLIWGTNRIHKS